MSARLFYPLLGSLLIINLTACTSVNNYIKTRKSQYLTSQNFPPLKVPPGIQIPREERYIIPPRTTNKPIQLPDLQPPTS